jgi:hypothetical protein
MQYVYLLMKIMFIGIVHGQLYDGLTNFFLFSFQNGRIMTEALQISVSTDNS